MGLLDSVNALLSRGPWTATPKAITLPATNKSELMERKFAPADDSQDWTHVQRLVSGPAASEQNAEIGRWNSAVFACLMAICTNYAEPPLRVYRRQTDGTEVWRLDHPWQRLLDKPTPNGELSLELLWFWTQWSKHTDGNAYWRKVRAVNEETGNVIQLWPMSPRLISPVTVKGSGNWIDYYKYEYEPGKFEAISLTNIIHFRLGVDDHDHRLGIAPLKRVVRSVTTDEEADKFVDALLRNYAVPGLVVLRKAPVTSRDEAEMIKAGLRQNFGSDNRGNVAIISGDDADVKQFGFSPKDLDMTILHRIPEERIAAVMRVPPIIAGLGAGLDRSTFANYREARESFTEQTLIPLWRQDEGTINGQLKPDFASIEPIFAKFDTTNVRALQEDETAKYNRLDIGVEHKWISVNEARTETGFKPIPGGDLDLEAEKAQAEAMAAALAKKPAADEEQPTDEEEQAAQEGKALARLAVRELSEHKARAEALRQFPKLVGAIRDLATPKLEAEIDDYLDDQRERVIETIKSNGK